MRLSYRLLPKIFSHLFGFDWLKFKSFINAVCAAVSCLCNKNSNRAVQSYFFLLFFLTLFFSLHFSKPPKPFSAEMLDTCHPGPWWVYDDLTPCYRHQYVHFVFKHCPISLVEPIFTPFCLYSTNMLHSQLTITNIPYLNL